MGCIDSTAATVQLYSMLNQITKEQFRNAIADDNPAAIASLETQVNYPNAIELSETGLQWTSLHFCCRFEAPKCLEYFLRKCYLLEPKDYLLFINHQTSEGSSCLHLCAIWNAKNCFALLVKYGGLNLSLKNKVGKTILGIARDYSRDTMASVIKALMKTEGRVTTFNYTLLEGSINYKSLQSDATYKKIIDKVLQSKDKQKKEKGQQQTNQEKQLQVLKKNIEKQKEELYKKRLDVLMKKFENEEEKQKIKPEKAGLDNQKNEGPNDNEQQSKTLSKEEAELEILYGQKMQQLANVKRAIDLLQYQTGYKLLSEEQTKAEKGRCPEQQLMEHFVVYKTHLVKMHDNSRRHQNKDETVSNKEHGQRDSLRTNKQNQNKRAEEGNQSDGYLLKSGLKSELIGLSNSSCRSPADLTNFKQLPVKVQKLYLSAQKNGHFIDREFPHSQNSLGGPQHQIRIKPFIDSMVWLRPDSFLGRFKLFDGIHPNDVKQGMLSICYCLATVSNLACCPSQIKQIFPFYDLSLGFYVLRFYTGGKPNFVVLDDYIPCNASSQQPLFSKPIGKQVWVLLIEKAWAKLIGSYFAAEMMTPDQFMQDLTGCPTFGAYFRSKKTPLKDIIECSSKGYPIVLTTYNKKMDSMVSSHAYSLLGIIEYNGSRIFKLRNPWGRFQWNGCYGQKSEAWTPQLKLKCQYLQGDDGLFFLSQAQLLQAFEYYSIGFNEPGFVYSFTEFKSKKDENIYFKFRHKGGKASFRVSQPFKRMLSDKDYRYSGLLFEVGRIVQNKVQFISEGNERCFRGEKSVYACSQILTSYEPGQYFVRIKVEWHDEQRYNAGVFSVFSAESTTIERVIPQSGKALWRELCFSFAAMRPLSVLNQNIKFSLHWMRGQMVCYAEMTPTTQAESLSLTWEFKPEQMNNCLLGLGKSSQNTIEYTVSKDRACIGIVQRLSLGKSCSSGKVSLKSKSC